MKLKILFPVLQQGIGQWLSAQVNEAVQDALENERPARMVTLSEVVINNKPNVPSFINRVKKDTSFYKAWSKIFDSGCGSS
ncbi:MAG: hypothetical protein J7599_10310 [Niabella sp.]|nr:hypothetical protein [Niabella sp.]